MTRQEKQFVKGVMLALVTLVPGGSTAQRFLDPLLEKVLKEEKYSPIVRATSEMLSELARDFHAYEELGVVNRGSGYAAANDFVEIVRRAEITPDLLVGLRLDAKQLEDHLTSVAQEELREASPGRRGLLRDAIKKFAAGILEVAPQSPAVQLRFMQSVLSRLD